MEEALVTKLQAIFKNIAGVDGRINLDEFKKAIGSKNDFFTHRLFQTFDHKNQGWIVQDEFIEFVMKIRTVDHKINLLFNVYDVNGNGQLDRQEVEVVIRAMIQESRLDVSKEEINELSKAFFEEGLKLSGNPGNEKITRDAFRNLVENNQDLTNDVTTLIDHWLGIVKDHIPEPKDDETYEEKEERRIIDLATKVQANPTFYSFFGIYVLIIILMMVIAAIVHRKAKDKNGDINLFLIIARIFGFPLNFVCMMVFVFMLGRLLNTLRSIGAITYLPLDHNLCYHIFSGWIIFIFGLIHSIVHFINFRVNVWPDPERYLAMNGLDKESAGYHPKEQGGNYTYSEWMLTANPHLFGLFPGWANVTGVALMAIVALMVITSLECVRRNGYFNLFYFFHLCYMPFAVLLILHAPNFSYFFPLIGVFVVLDLLERLCLGKKQTSVVAGILLPSNTVCLVLKKPEGRLAHKTGDWLSLNVPSIARHEWHAFTISSSPEIKDFLTLHIKVVGSWTKKLQEKLQQDFKKYGVSKEATELAELPGTCLIPNKNLEAVKIISYPSSRLVLTDVVTNIADIRDGTYPNLPFEVSYRGPYSAPATSIFLAEHAVLIATGIGVTPMTSILQTILYRHLRVTHTCPSCDNKWTDAAPDLGNLKKVDFIWIVRDPTQVSWFLELLARIELEQETLDSALPVMLNIKIYMTRALAKTDMCAVTLRIALNLLYQQTGQNIIHGLKSEMISGRPNLDRMFEGFRESGHEVSVFYCGNPIVGDLLQEKCDRHRLTFHREIF